MEVIAEVSYKEFSNYRVVGKFGGENVWRIYSFEAFGGKSLANE